MDIFRNLEEVKKLTKNFTEIEPDMLKKHQNFILPLRLICGLTHLDLTNIYLQKYGKIMRFNPYEHGITGLGDKVAERLALIFNENLPRKIDLEDIKRRYENIKKHIASHSIGNKLENKVSSLLLNKNIKFERNVEILGRSAVPIEVDFAIPNRSKPKVIVECKVTKGMSGHDSFRKARILALNSIELSTKTKFICVIGGRWSKNSMKLLKNYCIVINEEEAEKLINVIQNGR